MGGNFETLFPYLFPFVFLGFWLTISTVLGFMSGWFDLQRHYPRGDERPLLKLRGRSGSMGLVSLNGILSLSACPSGLRIGISRIFGPFQRPLFIPWAEIRATPSRSLFMPMVQLVFGPGSIGKLKIDARSWERLYNAASHDGTGKLPPPFPPIPAGKTARAMLLQWAAGTVAVGSFFAIASRLNTPPAPVPLAVCFGFPAVMFGIGTAIRFIRQA